MKIVRWACLMVLLFWQIALQGQSSTNAADSLAQMLQQANSPQERATVLQNLVQANWSSDRDQAKAYLRELEEVAGQLESDSITAFVYLHQGHLRYQAGEYETARALYEQASQLYEKSGLLSPALQCQARMGIMHSLQGAYPEAEALYRPALRKARQVGAADAEVFIIAQLGTLFHYQGVFDSAQQYYNAAIAHYRESGDSLYMTRPMYNLAVLQTDAGKYENSLQTYTAIYDFQMSREAYEDVMITLEGLSQVNKNMGRLSDAADNLLEAYHLSEQLGDVRMKVQALLGMALIEGEREAYDLCKSYLREALSLSLRLENADLIMAAYYRLGQLYHGLKEYDSAAVYITEAISRLDEFGTQRYAQNFLLQLGQVYANAGKLEQAEETVQQLGAYQPSTFGGQDLVSYYRLRGVISEAKGDHQGVIQYLSPSYEAYRKNRIYEQAKEDALTLMNAHKALGQTDEALYYAEAIHELRDTLDQSKDLERLAEQRKDFEFQLEKQKLEVEQAKEAAILKAQATQNLILAIGGLLLAVLASSFFWYTRRKNQTIALQNQQLQQLNETKDRLFAIIGHDLRKPAIAFRGITKKVNYLLRKKDFTTLERLGAEIEQDAAGLSQLTENLLNWALTQRDVMPYQPTQLKLLPLLEDTAAPFQTALQNKQLDLEWAIPEDTVIFSDANALSTIVRNLLDNAIKFTPEGGRITIEGTSDEGLFRLKVRDTGAGMPPEQLKELFLLKKGRTQPGTAGEKGSGLGLHLAHELSKLNQSTLGVSSNIGKGTIFTLSLPLKAT
ncbi:ATP-binding protein [Phaeodactylibacter sp.]|uniref:ATP-binding protein n=1 Tax=Phaeodactylibacter sp. TaxID=1940289 RepID=UPI0025D754D6|nr:ATP-binding protein [Phaeodactylibacter sp.]MCI4647773.1 ATP-binding protein [Phaeodactylibacter sp.]MCI5094112.1 ATP-binding protein [Phaeodactylibacter sp.]